MGSRARDRERAEQLRVDFSHPEKARFSGVSSFTESNPHWCSDVYRIVKRSPNMPHLHGSTLTRVGAPCWRFASTRPPTSVMLFALASSVILVSSSALIAPRAVPLSSLLSRTADPCMGPPAGFKTPPPKDGDYVDIFCRGVNGLMEQSVVGPVRAVAQVRDAQPQAATTPLDQEMFWRTVKSPPELPGLSRPVWLTIAASVPTALGWYGWYKFSVEEELFYDELRREGY